MQKRVDQGGLGYGCDGYVDFSIGQDSATQRIPCFDRVNQNGFKAFFRRVMGLVEA
jgi:hypothetical protein